MPDLRTYGIITDTRVAIFRSTGAGNTDILREEFAIGTVGGGNNQAGDSTILVAANERSVSPLPDDVPDSGSIRVLSPNDTGKYIRMTYSSVNRTTNVFTLTGTIGSFLIAEGEASSDLVYDDNIHVPLLEDDSTGTEISKTITWVSDIPLFVVARIVGKEPWYSGDWVFTTTGVDILVSFNDDNIVTVPPSPLSEISVDWFRRIVWGAAPLTQALMQEFVDTMRVRETDWAAMDSIYVDAYAGHAIDAEGKFEIEEGVFTGISVELRDFLFAFESRVTPQESGSVTTGDTTGTTLIDSTALFETNNIKQGATTCNQTDGSMATVLEVVSEIELTTQQLAGGIDNQWDVSDLYKVTNVDVCFVKGGNLVSRDADQVLQHPILTTVNTNTNLSLSTSGTFQESELIQFGSFGGVVTVDVVNGVTLEEESLAGNKQNPVKSVKEAVQIGNTRGFDTISFIGNATLVGGGTPDDVSNFTLEGQNFIRTTITIESGADVSNCTFRNMTLTGEVDGSCTIENCTVNDVTYFAGRVDRSRINTGLKLTGTELVDLIDCFSGEGGEFTLDVNGSRSVSIHRLSGDVRIKNFAGADKTITITGAGKVTLESTCTAGEIFLIGILNLDDNSGENCFVNVDGQATRAAIAETVWGESADPVTIDPVYGTDGTEYPQGTPTNPVRTIADAHTIGTRWGKRFLSIVGHGVPIVLTAGLDWRGWRFNGTSITAEDIVVLAGADVSGSYFSHLFLTGLIIGSSVEGERIFLGSVTISQQFVIHVAPIFGSVTLEDGAQFLTKDAVAVLNPTIFDLQGYDSLIRYEGWGDIRVDNLSGDGETSFTMNTGAVERSDTCDGGSLEIAGVAGFTNNGTGGTIIKDNQVDPVEVRDVYAMNFNKLELADGDTDNWELYERDDVTVRKTFSVTDKLGNQIVLPLAAPAKRSQGV